MTISWVIMHTGNDEYQKRYLEETRGLLCQRVSFILLVGIILIPLFGILDYVVAGEYFKLFLIYRLGCSAFLIGLYLISLTDIGKDHVYLIAIISYIVSGLTISMMCVHLGGYESYYYVEHPPGRCVRYHALFHLCRPDCFPLGSHHPESEDLVQQQLFLCGFYFDHYVAVL